MRKTLGQIAYEAMQKSEGGFTWNWEQSAKQHHWEAAASAVWNEAVEACIDAIRQRPVKSGGTAWDEGMNDARIQHIRTLAALKRSEDTDV